MWYRKSKAQSTSEDDLKKQLASMGVQYNADMDIEGNDDLVNVDDDDDDLQRELALLQGLKAPPKKKENKKGVKNGPAKGANFDNNNLEDIGKTELTEDDLNDPELLAQLSEIGGDVSELEAKNDDDDMSFEENDEEGPDANEVARKREEHIVKLTGLVDEYKKTALAAKKAGDKQAAIQAMQQMKTYQQQLSSFKDSYDLGLLPNSSPTKIRPQSLESDLVTKADENGSVERGPPMRAPTFELPGSLLAPTDVVPPPIPVKRQPVKDNSYNQIATSTEDKKEMKENNVSVLPAVPPRPHSIAKKPLVVKELKEEVEVTPLVAFQQRMGEYKVAALASKKAGNKQQALEYMKVIKMLQPMIENIEMGFPADMSQLPPSPVGKTEESPVQGSPPMASPLPATPYSTPTSVTSPAPVATQRPAVRPYLPPAGETPKAEVSSILASHGRVPIRPERATGPSPLMSGRGLLHAATTASNESGARVVPQKRTILNQHDISLYGTLETALKEQETSATEIAKYFLQSGDKQEAMRFNKLRKAYMTDQALLQSLKMSSKPPPSVQYDVILYRRIRSFPDIGPNQVEMHLGKCTGLSELEDKGVYVVYDFAYPRLEEKQTGLTSALKGSTVDFNTTVLLNMSRKHFSTFCQRRSLDLRLEYKAGIGFFKKAVIVGSVKIGLKEFDKTCEISRTVSFLDGRKDIGVKLSFYLRIQTPTGGQEVKEETAKWLRVIQDKPITPTIQAPRPTSTSSEPPKRAAVVPQPPVVEEDTTDMEGDPEDLSEQFSNAVLEHEVEQMNQTIIALKTKGQSIPPELTDRKMQAETAMQILILNVNTGKLTPEDYAGMLRTKVGEEKALAIRLKHKGKIDWATVAMKRAKLMYEEIQSINPDEPPIPPAPQPVKTPAPQPVKTPAPQPIKTPIPQPTKTPSPAQQPTAPIRPASSSGPSSHPQSNTQSVANTPKTIATPEADEDLEGDPDNVSGHVSNNVFEWELERVNQQIIGYKTKGKAIPEEVTFKKSQIELGVQMLVIQVQTGALTMEGYLDGVKTKIKEEKQLAIKLKNKNNLEWAKLALTRMKIMEKEVAEAESAAEE